MIIDRWIGLVECVYELCYCNNFQAEVKFQAMVMAETWRFGYCDHLDCNSSTKLLTSWQELYYPMLP